MKGKSMLLSYSDSEGKQVFTPSKDIRLVRGGVKLVGHLVNGVYLDNSVPTEIVRKLKGK